MMNQKITQSFTQIQNEKENLVDHFITIKKQLNVIDVLDLKRLINKSKSAQQCFQEKSIILFIGDTGAVKTTTILSLLGYKSNHSKNKIYLNSITNILTIMCLYPDQIIHQILSFQIFKIMRIKNFLILMKLKKRLNNASMKYLCCDKNKRLFQNILAKIQNNHCIYDPNLKTFQFFNVFIRRLLTLTTKMRGRYILIFYICIKELKNHFFFGLLFSPLDFLLLLLLFWLCTSSSSSNPNFFFHSLSCTLQSSISKRASFKYLFFSVSVSSSHSIFTFFDLFLSLSSYFLSICYLKAKQAP